MEKTRRLIAETVGKCDVVVEITDARIPESSGNAYLRALVADKPRMIILNKADLADPIETAKWQKYYISQGAAVLVTDCKTKKGLSAFRPLLDKMLSEKIERLEKRDLGATTKRVMVVGVPNSGKSTFINAVSGRNTAKAEDRPGVTRDVQIIHAGGVDLYDMPGILMPKIEDPEASVKLAATGAIGENAYDPYDLACRFCGLLKELAPSSLTERYKITVSEGDEPHVIVDKIARKRGFISKGGELDTERASIILLDEFRGGKLGRITLDRVKNDG